MIAAKILGHNFTGLEISHEYIEFAKTRLQNDRRELESVNEEIAKHVVVKTFKERKEMGEFTGKYGKNNIKTDNQPKALDLIFSAV